MNDVLFTEEAKRLLLSGELKADAVSSLSEDNEVYPPLPAKGEFNLNSIEFKRLKKNKVRATFITPSGLNLAVFETTLPVGDSLRLAGIAMSILIKLP